MNYNIFAIIIAILLIISVCSASTIPTLAIDDGKIQGHIINTINGREIAAFEGIPYAEPPIGNLRFQSPVRNKPWSHTWIANVVHTCLQYSHGPEGVAIIKGNEDCLYLNVYKPNGSLNGLNVIVYIHGGAFMFNAGGAHRPFYIMDKDVIFVTINYRLGPLGFLSLEDDVLPGNVGLKDQTLALKWIKDNIHHFGGNSDSITIAGMSAGGASVHLHTLSPTSRGLFNRVISQSGVAINSWVLTENSRKKAHKLGELLGCTCTDSKDLLNCLKARPGQQIMEAIKHFQVFLYTPFTPFGPVIDEWSNEPFLPEHPLILMEKKEIEDVPILFSFVSCEGLYPAADFATDIKYLKKIDQNWDEIVPFVLDYNNTVSSNGIKEVNKRIREEYFNDKRVTMDTYDNLIRMITDRLFVGDIQVGALLHSNAIKSRVYSYKLSYVGENGLTSIRAPNMKFNCTGHADDTYYVIPPRDFMRTTERDAQMSDIFINIWTSFADNGIPSVDGIEWLPVTKRNDIFEYLHIESPEDIEMDKDVNLGNVKFWNTLPLKDNVKSFDYRDEL